MMTINKKCQHQLTVNHKNCHQCHQFECFLTLNWSPINTLIDWPMYVEMFVIVCEMAKNSYVELDDGYVDEI